MRRIIGITIMLISTNIYSQLLVDYKLLSPNYNEFEQYNSSFFLLYEKKESNSELFKAIFDDEIKIEPVKIDSKDQVLLDSINNIFWSPNTEKSYGLVLPKGKLKQSDAYYEVIFRDNSIKFSEYIRMTYDGLKVPNSVIRENEEIICDYTFNPKKGIKGISHSIRVESELNEKKVLSVGEGAPTFYSVGNNYFLVEEKGFCGGNNGWDTYFETYLYNSVTKDRTRFNDEVPIGFGNGYIITTNEGYIGFKIYDSDLKVLYVEEMFSVLGKVNEIGSDALLKTVKFDGRFLFYDLWILKDWMFKDCTVIIDIKTSKSFYTENANITILGIF